MQKLILLALACLACTASALDIGQPLPYLRNNYTLATIKGSNSCGNADFDYFLLQLTWPVTECKKMRCQKKLSPQFQIHGLWANKIEGRHPSNCCRSKKFDAEQLGDIKEDLKKYWPTLNKKGDESFWKHEWDKHGTCSASNKQLDSLYKYFATTLKLYKEANIAQWLAEEGIVPQYSISQTYELTSVHNAISKNRPYAFRIGCQRVKSSGKSVSVLQSVNLCYDKWSLQPIDCDRFLSNCQKTVHYPTIGGEYTNY